jgi:predicted TIM-barrel fold metal-dependent hydrolase
MRSDRARPGEKTAGSRPSPGTPPPAAFPIVDAHLHMQPWEMMKPAVLERMRHGRPDFDDLLALTKDPGRFLGRMDREGIERAWIINYTSPDLMGFTPGVNRYVADFCARDPKRLFAFGSIHPTTGDGGGPRTAGEVRADMDALASMGIRGIKLHPPHQLFSPDDYRDGKLPALAALYEKAIEHRMPVMIHTGTSIFPGARSRLGNPMPLDDVAVDFPDLVLVLAHAGRPLWMEECFFLARRHPNLHLDVSGIPPKTLLEYFPRLEAVSDKVLFGTDWPGPGVPDPARNIADFRALAISGEAQRKILRENALRILS